MKRNRAAVVTTVSTVMIGAGWVAGVVGTAASSTGGGISIDALGPGTGVASAATSPSSANPSPSASASASPSASASAAPSVAATTDPAQAPAPAPVTTPPPAPAGPTGTYDGAAVKTRYGTYQAELTIEAGTITNITMLQSGASDGTSRQISGNALPQLISAVLQNQTANVGYVSGASFTSQGFEVSVQDAMSQAGL